MSGNLQPNGLFVLAFGSFITYMENEARQLMKLYPSPEAVTVTSRVCRELKRFFHGTILPTSVTNQLTKHLLIKLDSMYYMFGSYICTKSCQQMLLSLVEVFMHPDVTAIELGRSYFHEFDFISCNFITSIILAKVYNLHKLKVLSLPACRYSHQHLKPIFPSQLKELKVYWTSYSWNNILESILQFCPELKSLTVCECELSFRDIPLLLQCKHLETLRISRIGFRIGCKTANTDLTVMKGLSTDTASDVLTGSTLKSLSLRLTDQITLRLIVDKLPNLTDIELSCKDDIDLSSLTQLKNLRSLCLSASDYETANEYKKILPVLGKNLVFLELRGYCVFDLQMIGETCTHLKCLHLHSYIECGNVNPCLKTIPNFKTIECLKIPNLSRDFVPFLITQCVNIKTLILDFYKGILNSTIEDALRRTPPLDWVVIMHDLSDCHLIESLPSRHPNFHVVKTRYWMRLSSQAEVFDSFGCYI